MDTLVTSINSTTLPTWNLLREQILSDVTTHTKGHCMRRQMDQFSWPWWSSHNIYIYHVAHLKSIQFYLSSIFQQSWGKKYLVSELCPALCDSRDCNPSSFSVHGISQAYWSWLPFPFPGHLPKPRTQGWNPCLLHWQADSLPLSHQGSPDFCYLFLLWLHHSYIIHFL